MTGHIDGQLAELLFGDVSAEDRTTMEAHASECARCARALAELTEDFATLALTLPPEAPSPALRARLLSAVKPHCRLFLLDKVAQLFDLSRERARALLDKVDQPDAWDAGPVEGSWLLFVDGGPRLDGALCAFLRLGPSVRWPPHRHLGTEQMLVLEGGFREDDGHEVHAGDVHVMNEGTEHGFSGFADEGCLCAATVVKGVEFLNMPPQNDSPDGVAKR